MTTRVKREITKKFKHIGFSLKKDAVNTLLELHSECNNAGQDFDDVLSQLTELTLQKNSSSVVLSANQLQPIIEQMNSAYDPITDESTSIIDSFEFKRYRYQRVRKVFADVPKGPIHGSAEDQTAVFRDRYELLLQRTLRHPMFSQSTFKTNEQTEKLSLTTTAELAGTKGQKTVLGMLCELTEGKLSLQDVNGCINVDISEARKSIGLYTWNSFVLAQGTMQQGIFVVDVMGLPPHESRVQTTTVFNNLEFVPYDKRKQMAEMEEKSVDEMYVFLSNVHLDQNKTLTDLEKLFSGYSAMDVPPMLFIFMGNYSKERLGTQPKDMKKLQSLFDNLCDLICKFKKLVDNCDFIFIPGPNDPSVGNVLPRPGLLPSLTRKLRSTLTHCHFPSNPCRIRFCTQEIVIFREDLLQRMRRNCIVLPNMSEEKDLSAHLAKTVLDQSHLCPMPIVKRPVYWNYDHALQLYPVPHVLILADSHTEYKYRIDDCLVVCPGEFSDQSFLAYSPCDRTVDFSKIP